jgi:uncharacterized protein (DUF1697 family)
MPESARTWVAFLRAINLGNRNKVPMHMLRRTFEDVGCARVRTYLQSGNVIFEKEHPNAGALEVAVAAALDVETVVTLRTPRQLRTLVASHSLGADTTASHVIFLARKPAPTLRKALSALDVAPDRFMFVGRDLVVTYPRGFHGARLTPARLERELGVPVTLRSWRTVTRLAELVSG